MTYALKVYTSSQTDLDAEVELGKNAQIIGIVASGTGACTVRIGLDDAGGNKIHRQVTVTNGTAHLMFEVPMPVRANNTVNMRLDSVLTGGYAGYLYAPMGEEGLERL